MPLELQGPRPLSPLERDAVKLVFWDSLNPCDVYLTVYEARKGAGGYRGNGNLRINRLAFPHTDALNIDSTRGNTDILKPGNMKYLSTLIHECTHQWQSNYDKYTISDGQYGFTQKQLQTLDLMKEQHASAAQVYFVVDWQLKHQPRGYNADLTTYEGKRVGAVERYRRISDIEHTNYRRIVTSTVAKDISDDFRVFLNDLRSRGQWAG